MNLKIENVGIIKHADVKLNGLTVIAGENDSGKSTVGKLIFSIVKAVSWYEQSLKSDRSEKISRMIEDIYVLVRRLDNSISSYFLPTTFRVELGDFPNDGKSFGSIPYYARPDIIQDNLFDFLNNRATKTNSTKLYKIEDPLDTFDFLNNNAADPNIIHINQVFAKKIDIIGEQKNIKLTAGVIPKLEELRKYILWGDDKQKLMRKSLEQVLFSEFYNELSPKDSNLQTSKVELIEGTVSTYQFSMKDNVIDTLSPNEVLYFNDATFVESPIVLQMYDMLSSTTTLLELADDDKAGRINNFSKPKVPLHLKDLISKLENAQYLRADSSQEDLLLKISNIIDGNFSFDKKGKDFSYSKNLSESEKFKNEILNNTISIKSVNTSSGIKSFGIVQLLIQAGVIDSRSLLIIDEPETHLHPKWQLEYAKILVELAKNDISVLVTSHSPYLIQALKVFSDNENIKDRTTFYLAEKNLEDDFSKLFHSACTVEIHDVTHNLNRLFSKLADPLRELV